MTPKEAFKIASNFCDVPLAHIAVEWLGCWVFDYGGQTMIDGFWPVSVEKKSGRISLLVFDDAFNFWDKKESLPFIDVGE